MSCKKTFLIAINILLLFWACSCAGKNERDTIEVVVLRGPSAIAFARWMEQPPRIGGKQVVVSLADSPEQVQAAMIRKDADIAVLPMINAANLHNKLIGYQLAGCPIWGNLYLVGQKEACQLHLFGAGTTPDILARYFVQQQDIPYTLNYTLTTPAEITRGLLAGKVEAAVLAEPFVSYVLRQNSQLHILTDLNNPTETSPGFAETAILFRKELAAERAAIDSLLANSCSYANEYPSQVIQILEAEKIFPPGMLTAESIDRCRIAYIPAAHSKKEIESFLQIIYRYEPKALGGKMPDNSFYP